MSKIVRIHEKILDHLIKLRQDDNELYFVPRKINNKNRLEEGYWFLGNDSYLSVSFWDGGDWKEKIHNIGFVVNQDKSSYVELSAQDSPIKAIFLSKIADKIDGFKKIKNKDKWYKNYSGNNYIENLNDFILNTKPIIDELLKNQNQEGIKLLDELSFNELIKKVIKRRENQIKFGVINKLSKICWNTQNWQFPSGSQGKSVSIESYEASSGFGHEEWLFDKSRIIDGYHYAFLQPLNIKTGKHLGMKYNISLYTINNLNKYYYVGTINNVECINSEESKRIFQIYEMNGWIEQMKRDVKRVGANSAKFIETSPESFFNIRFKFFDLSRPDELTEISETDINITTNRYKLLPKKSEILLGTEIINEESEGNKKNTNKRKKTFNVECEYDPYHDQMQNSIFDLLKKSSDYKKVFIEKGRVDIKALTNEDTWHYFEIKTSNPKISIRNALGQIMEYAFFPDTQKAAKLIIVADETPNEDIITYLKHIRELFNLPITYRYYNLEKNELSCEY